MANALAVRPISVAVDGQNFRSYKNGIFYNCGTNLSLAVLLVGMTDQYWALKNSWGRLWGENGYIRIGRGNTCGVCNAASYPYWLIWTPDPSLSKLLEIMTLRTKFESYPDSFQWRVQSSLFYLTNLQFLTPIIFWELIYNIRYFFSELFFDWILDLIDYHLSDHCGTYDFQMRFKHLSSFPETLLSLLVSQCGSLIPKRAKSWVAERLSISFKVRPESEVSRSFFNLSAKSLLLNVLILLRLRIHNVFTSYLWLIQQFVHWLMVSIHAQC